MAGDKNCICKGNWRNIIKETEPLFGSEYIDKFGKEYIFIGVLHGEDDYYYCLWNILTSVTSLLSCVGSIEGWGYTLIKEEENE